MKYIDGFRDHTAAACLVTRVKSLAEKVGAQGRTINIMEVCGTHTMAIAHYGIRDILPDTVNLISGPGCPVCVTAAGYVDAAIKLAEEIAKYPGEGHSSGTLQAAWTVLQKVVAGALVYDVRTLEPSEAMPLVIALDEAVDSAARSLSAGPVPARKDPRICGISVATFPSPSPRRAGVSISLATAAVWSKKRSNESI